MEVPIVLKELVFEGVFEGAVFRLLLLRSSSISTALVVFFFCRCKPHSAKAFFEVARIRCLMVWGALGQGLNSQNVGLGQNPQHTLVNWSPDALLSCNFLSPTKATEGPSSLAFHGLFQEKLEGNLGR